MQRNLRRRRHGFTLMEVLLVLAILVILGSLVGFAFTRVQRDSYSKSAQVQINTFKTAMQIYFRDHGAYPQNLEDLRNAPGGANDQWKGPYLDEDVPLDPWSRPYQYRLVDDGYGEQTYEIYSMGPDGQPDTEDDISNRPKKK